MAKDKTVSIRFSQAEYDELRKECDRLQLPIAAYIRSSALMRLNGDLIDKDISEAERHQRRLVLRRLDESNSFG